jgi:hypothetical protein
MPNIADLTRQLREEIRKQYGVEARIAIGIHGHYDQNKFMNNKGTAEQLANAISFCYTGHPGVCHWEHNGVKGVRALCNDETDITLFYKNY